MRSPVNSLPMSTIASTPPLKFPANGTSVEPHRTEVLRQLEKIMSSSHFRNSKRYPALLKFVVENTLAGREDVLKERTLGVEVFGKSSDYDTNTDPVVRVTAGEIRKRLAQYYQAVGHEHEPRIELPVGSYVPQFSFASADPGVAGLQLHEAEITIGPQIVHGNFPEAGMPGSEGVVSSASAVLSPSTLTKRRFSLVSMATLFVVTLAAAALPFGIQMWKSHATEKSVNSFWKPFLSSDNTALIVIGVHSLDSEGKDLSPALYPDPPPEEHQNMLASMIRSEMVPVSDIVSYSELTKLLTEHGHTYRTQGSTETSFSQLQRGPVILVGGFDNAWTLRLTSTLRYRFNTPGALVGVITDSKNPANHWSFDNGQSALSNSRDYAIVARLFDPRIDQYVLIAAGIGKSGTVAAAEFLTNNNYLNSWLSQTKLTKSKNVEIVLTTEIVEGQPGPPQVIASYTW